MKKCPYCAEEIQDEAIKCRYCFSDLTVSREEALTRTPEPTPVAAGSEEPPVAEEAPAAEEASSDGSPAEATAATAVAAAPATPADVKYSHTGYRYVLGYGADFFGIWDRQAPGEPVHRFARTDEGWRDAWVRFAGLEPNAVAVTEGQPAAAAAAAPAATPAPQAAPPTTPDPNDVTAVQYTHSGTRYLLGYGRTFFGIWDRQNPAMPTERFPRTDDGWAQAWRRYTQIETHFSEVGLTR